MNNICCYICSNINAINDNLRNTIDSLFRKDMIFFSESNFSTNLCSYNDLKNIADTCTGEYVLLINNAASISILQQSVKRFREIADMTSADIIYSDFYKVEDDIINIHKLNDYHTGCVRNDFEMGDIFFIRCSTLKRLINKLNPTVEFAAFYALRLRAMIHSIIEHIPEPLYTKDETSNLSSENEHFNYVDPSNKNVQTEMEAVFTKYLHDINAHITSPRKKVDFNIEAFNYEASVIIPVKNRAKTIGDAINSALNQECKFKYNIIVVDNYSNDGTTKIIKKLKDKNPQIVHIIPESKQLGIGGCWNIAINHHLCGKFAIQLDSDDTYNNPFTLNRIVEKFYEKDCAMVIGSYQITNFNNEIIPPGIIDHNEWTDENGMNNALRINGLGAPRAFYTPIIRKLLFPNTSYGEDYAVGIAISREYSIGRILDPIYNCRRWEGNSDANINHEKLNEFNAYKDKLRYFEIIKRMKLNSDNQE